MARCSRTEVFGDDVGEHAEHAVMNAENGAEWDGLVWAC